MENLYIIGAGGLAREVASLVDTINTSKQRYYLKGFVVDDEYFTDNAIVAGLPVFRIRDIGSHDSFANAIGNSEVREKMFDRIKKQGGNPKFPPLVHPRASIGPRVFIGDGTIICEGSILTCDIDIGRFVIVNLNTTIGHDAKIDDYCTMNPTCTISGNVVMDKHVFVGTGANILETIHIGEFAKVGGGALVNRDVDRGKTVVGIPAKALL